MCIIICVLMYTAHWINCKAINENSSLINRTMGEAATTSTGMIFASTSLYAVTTHKAAILIPVRRRGKEGSGVVF
jgi:hypothetical protein